MVYLVTLYPGVGGRVNYGDSAKWQFLWAIGGTPHSTGYPTFLLLSRVFGNTFVFLQPATRITLISVLSALGTLWVLYKISEIFITTTFARIVPAFLLGCSSIFWSQATEAEVYTLNALFVSLVIYFSIRFHITANVKYFVIAMAIYAVSFGNHVTMITLLPALIYIIFATDYTLVFTKKVIGLTLLFVVIGASQYLYLLYLSHAGSPQLEYIGPDATIGRWLSYITGGQFRTRIAANTTFDAIYYHEMPKFARAFSIDMGWAVFIMAVFFLLYQKIKPPSYNKSVVFLTLIAVFQLFNAFSYVMADIIVYYIPIFLVSALLLAKTLDVISSYSCQSLLALLLVFASISFMPLHYQVLEVDSNPMYDHMHALFQFMPPDSTVFIPDGDMLSNHWTQVFRFVKYIDFPEKNIHHTAVMHDTHGGALYFPATFLKTIPLAHYAVKPLDDDRPLYVAIPKVD